MRTIKVEVDSQLWEAFYRIFPGQGERTAFLRKVIRKTVEEAENKDCFLHHLWQKLEEETSG